MKKTDRERDRQKEIERSTERETSVCRNKNHAQCPLGKVTLLVVSGDESCALITCIQARGT